MRGRFTLLASQLCRLELIFSPGCASAAIETALCSLRAGVCCFFFLYIFSLLSCVFFFAIVEVAHSQPLFALRYRGLFATSPRLRRVSRRRRSGGSLSLSLAPLYTLCARQVTAHVTTGLANSILFQAKWSSLLVSVPLFTDILLLKYFERKMIVASKSAWLL